MRSISAIFVTLLYLSMAVGISVNSHYCGGLHVSSAIVVEAPSCGHHVHADMCNEHEPVQKEDKGCCSTDSELFQLQEQPMAASSVSQLPAVVVLNTWAPQAILVNTMPLANAEQVSHPINKPPPLTVSGHLALVQSFLL